MHFYEIQRRILQLILDTFIDIEEKEENEALDFSAIMPIVKILNTELPIMLKLIRDDNYEKYYI